MKKKLHKPKSKPKFRIPLWVIACLPLVLGVVLLWRGVVMMEYEEGLEKWPSTKGMIEKVKDYKEFPTKQTTIFGLSVTYRYTVHHKVYHSSRLTLDGNYESMLSEEVDKVRKQYKTGKKVDVYYNPDKPEDSVLLRDESISNGRTYPGLFINGFTALLLGLLLLIPNIFSKKKKALGVRGAKKKGRL